MVTNLKKFFSISNMITDMEKAVELCESRTPELSRAATRSLDVAYYADNEIDKETYLKEMDKITTLANKFMHECPCTKKKDVETNL